MKKIDIEELQFFIAEVLEKDEFYRRWPRYELEHPEHIEGDAYSIGVAVGVSRARYALEKFLSIDHTGIIDSILKEAGIKKSYKDGNQFCILLGEDLQSGICGFGKTKQEALVDFLRAVRRYFVQHEQPDGYNLAMIEVKAKVDELYDETSIGLSEYDAGLYNGIIETCMKLRGFIKARTSKEQPEVELEKEIKNYLATKCAGDDEPSVSEIARHFYELARQKYEK